MFYLFVNGNAETMSPDKEPLESMAEEIKADGKGAVVAEFELSLDPYYLELVDGVVQVKKPPADAPIDDGTEAQKKAENAQLDAQYQAAKMQLMQYYFEFSIAGDTDGTEALKAELEALNQQYDNDLEALKGSE